MVRRGAPFKASDVKGICFVKKCVPKEFAKHVKRNICFPKKLHNDLLKRKECL